MLQAIMQAEIDPYPRRNHARCNRVRSFQYDIRSAGIAATSLPLLPKRSHISPLFYHILGHKSIETLFSVEKNFLLGKDRTLHLCRICIGKCFECQKIPQPTLSSILKQMQNDCRKCGACTASCQKPQRRAGIFWGGLAVACAFAFPNDAICLGQQIGLLSP